MGTGDGPVVDGMAVGAGGGHGCCPMEANGSLLLVLLEK